MNIFSGPEWEETRKQLLEGLSKGNEALVSGVLERQREDIEKFAPQRAFNAALKDRIQQIRIKRNLVNNRRKHLGLKLYRPKISVFAKRQQAYPDMPMIRRIIPGTIAGDIAPLQPTLYVGNIFGQRREVPRYIETAK